MIRSAIPLTLGWERLPKSYSVRGEPSGQLLIEPVTAVVLDSDDGWILLDTGFNTALIRDEPLYRRFHGRNHDIEAILPETDCEPLVEELAQHGVELGDITRIVLSHLHNDHAGGLRLFEPGIPVHVQRVELEYGLNGHPFPERHGMFRVDFDDPEINWQLMDGDEEIVPGLHAVFTPGHTPGHQSFIVELADGAGYAFAFDAADLTENINEEIGPGGFVHCDADVPLGSLLRFKAIAAQRSFPVIPGHDPEAWPALTRALLGG